MSDMKLSFNTWVYSSFPIWVPAYPLEETIRRIARIGYDGIEIGAAAPHAYPAYMSPERRRAIRKVLDDNNIVVSAMLPAPGGGPGFNVASPSPEAIIRFPLLETRMPTSSLISSGDRASALT